MSQLGQVAILQNKLGTDGRSRVVASIIEALNALGVSPDIFILSGKGRAENFERGFQKSGLRYQLQTVLPKVTINGITLVQQSWLNMTVRGRLEQYDLVISSNNSLAWLPKGPHYLYYIHDPVPMTIAYNKQIRSPLKWYPYKVMMALFEENAPFHLENTTFVANSHYTLQRLRQAYQLGDHVPCQVVYPPSFEDGVLAAASAENRTGVVSVGRFCTAKRQLEQLEIARRLPAIHFTLIGSAESKAYFQRCEKFVADNGLTNVTLKPNASYAEVLHGLQSAKLFLLTKYAEQFGIAVVEALASGCVPVVHNSGGPREIVADPDLCFDNVDEATIKIQRLIESDLAPIQEQLLERAPLFSAETFKRTITEIILQQTNPLIEA